MNGDSEEVKSSTNVADDVTNTFSELDSSNKPSFEVASISTPEKSSSKKKWIVIGVLAAALVIVVVVAVVVVINNNRSNNVPEEVVVQEGADDKIDDEARRIYNAAASEITAKILQDDQTDSDGTGESVISLYLKKISETNNKTAKAMLLLDYYQMLMVYQPTLELKDTVLNGLISADKILETANSAMAVAEAAEYYGDTKIVEQYNQLVNERMAAGNFGFHGGDEEVEE